MNLTLLLGAAVVVAAMTAGAYFNGKAADRERSDLVILKLQTDAARDLTNATASNAATSIHLQTTKEKAEHDLQTERARGARRVADAAATAGLVRDELAAFASGAGAGETSVLACVDRGKTLGELLVESVRVQNALAEDGESCEANIRALRVAWPVAHQPQ